MKIIVVKNDHAQTYSLQAIGLRFVFVVFLLVILIAAIGAGGAYVWLKASKDSLLTYEGLRNWQATLGDQKQGLVFVKQKMERQLDALTLRLAQLQGRITRLDALGERLITKSNLDDGEFDFTEPPATGGPLETAEVSDLYTKPALIDVINQLADQIDNREQQLNLLDSLIANRAHHSDTFVAGVPVAKGWLSSRFGRRADPFTGKASWHNGIDFAGKKGTPILAMAAGVVTWARDRSGYGLLVEVNHGNGYVTRYAHSDSVNVEVGDIVKRGQMIAKMGNSGRSTGNHVHIEVLKNGKPEDPSRYIYRKATP
ncbi:MAG: M23 family metallopeptidase [Endozoicomonas sp. (ex Botrylloides leachii)]|nr:M23 family metallopeptidase [Endozoicomonas sp. (ex Botrylloides leachii)]